ncbi:right-handed parallel beta-helix repeat-containing protein [Leifsonia lichenia]
MNRILIRTAAFAASALLLTGLATATGAAAAPTVEVHAAEYGKGSTCTAADTCSIHTALSTAVTLAKKGQRPTVLLHKGTYRLTKGIELGPEAAGVSIQAAGDGEPIIDGGLKVTNWKPAPEVGDGVFKAQLPADTAVFRELYDYGVRGVLARYPNRTDEVTAGPYLRLPAQPEATSPAACEASGRFAPCELTMPAIPSDSVSGEWWHGAQLVKIDHWRYKELNIASVAPAGGNNTRVGFAGETKAAYAQGDFHRLWDNTEPVGSPYYFQDSLALLDDAREWFYDQESRVVYYKSAKGIAPDNGDVIVPQVEKLLAVSNTSDITVSGITFQHSNWAAPKTVGYVASQGAQPQWTPKAETPVPGAVNVTSGTDITLSGNSIRRTGAHGITVEGTSATLTIADNRISDTSSGGISLYAGISHELRTHDTLNTARVTGNVVQDTGKHYADGPGIFGSHVCDTRIENNDVSYTKFSGITVGLLGATLNETKKDGRCMMPGQLSSPEHYNTVSKNRISNSMMLLDDGAGIYLMARNPFMRVEENYISGVQRSVYAGNNNLPGIYLDGTSWEMTVAKNVLDIGDTNGFYIKPENTLGNVIRDNWHTGPSGKLDQDGLTASDNEAVPDAAWPDAALEVIAQAGLTGGSALPRPLTVTSPAPGFPVYEDKPVFAGQAQPGNTIQLRSKTDYLLGEATADEDGRWSIRVNEALGVNTEQHRVIVNEWRPGTDVKTELPTDQRVVTFTRLAPVVITSPVDGRNQFAQATFTGTAAPDATIEVRGARDNKVLATATVDAAGNWSARVPDVSVAPGQPYSYSALEFVGTARVSTDTVSYTRLKADQFQPLVFTSPTSTTDKRPVITGTGEPGYTVKVTGSAGGHIGTTVVGADGTWAVQPSFDLGVGGYDLLAYLWIERVVEQKVHFLFSVTKG